MKHIQKAGAPRGYSQWCATVVGTNKADYRELPATEKQALLAALIIEQGALCAYTMRRIGADSAHVEHISQKVAVGRISLSRTSIMATWLPAFRVME